MDQHRVAAVLFAGSTGSYCRKGRVPSVMVPGSFISGFEGKEPPDYPLGIAFTGRAWSEHKLLSFAFVFERLRTCARRLWAWRRLRSVYPQDKSALPIANTYPLAARMLLVRRVSDWA